VKYYKCVITFLFTVVSAAPVGAQDINKTISFLEEQDPVSCVSYDSELIQQCKGAAAGWQLGRLAIAVELTSVALKLAGMSYSSDVIQSAIYRDSLKNGLDESLILPTMNLIDLAELGSDGPLAEEATSIYSLSMLSLESLFPGFTESQGKELLSLPGVSPSESFQPFGDFVDHDIIETNTPNTDNGYRRFLPVTHSALKDSKPILRAMSIKIFNENGVPRQSGRYPVDFFFTNTDTSNIAQMKDGKVLEGSPITRAYTDILITNTIKYGADLNSSFGVQTDK